MTGVEDRRRVDALADVWQAWAGTVSAISQPQWSWPTRCPAWDVAALVAHHSRLPLFLAQVRPPDGEHPSVYTAEQVLRRFNEPGGVSTQMANSVGRASASEAQRVATTELVGRFTTVAPATVQVIRHLPPDRLTAWPGVDGGLPMTEAAAIAITEASVHLLDLQRALHEPPDVPAAALDITAHLLTALAPAVELIEAATGRSQSWPLPVLR